MVSAGFILLGIALVFVGFLLLVIALVFAGFFQLVSILVFRLSSAFFPIADGSGVLSYRRIHVGFHEDEHTPGNGGQVFRQNSFQHVGADSVIQLKPLLVRQILHSFVERCLNQYSLAHIYPPNCSLSCTIVKLYHISFGQSTILCLLFKKIFYRDDS